MIFIGVDNDRQVVGRSWDQSTDDRINQAAVDAHNVGRYRIRQITVDQVPVVVVAVNRREDGFAQTSDGRILVRHGAWNQPLIGNDVWRLASSRTLRRFECSSAGVRRGEVDDELLLRVCAAHGWDAAVVDLDDRLRERGLLCDDDELTVAGALVLTDPAQTLNASKLVVEIRWYDGAGPDPRRRMAIGGSLPEQVSSPGPLPEGVTVATIRRAQAARNPSVIAVLRQFGLTEDAGRGVDVMRDEMLDPPIFEEIGEFVRVTLPIKGPITPQERAWLKDLEEWHTLAPVGRLLLVHAARRHPVRKLERRGGKLLEVGESTMPRRLTNAEARKITGLDREEARTALKRLCDQGFLTQHGERGGAYYLLNPTLIQGAAHGMTDEEIEQLVLDAAKQQAIRNEDVRRLTGLDSTAVGSMLRRLTERGQLERRGEKRGTEYVHTVSDQS